MKYLFALFFIYIVVVQSAVRSHRKERIANGNIANNGQFPFVAGIFKSTLDEGPHFCAGALINNQFVLTSGECVAGALFFNIHLGSHNLSDTSALKIFTDIYFLHPDYNATTLYNNIGIIKLPSAVTFTEYITPVANIYNDVLPEYSTVVTMAWGQTSSSSSNLEDTLRYVYLTVLGNLGCRLVFGNKINDYMVCVGINSNAGTCWGDFGAPLIEYREDDSAVNLVGISSFIRPGGCESSEPSVFTWLSPYRSWIYNIISK